eukprot:scaffold5611_cov132-Isochrysis_galbana.AAC.10
MCRSRAVWILGRKDGSVGSTAIAGLQRPDAARKDACRLVAPSEARIPTRSISVHTRSLRRICLLYSFCLKNAVNENAVNGRKTCKRDSKEHGQGSMITRTLTKDRRDTQNLDTPPQQDDCWMGDESALSLSLCERTCAKVY